MDWNCFLLPALSNKSFLMGQFRGAADPVCETLAAILLRGTINTVLRFHLSRTNFRFMEREQGYPAYWQSSEHVAVGGDILVPPLRYWRKLVEGEGEGGGEHVLDHNTGRSYSLLNPDKATRRGRCCPPVGQYNAHHQDISIPRNKRIFLR